MALSKEFFEAFQFPGISRTAFNSFLAPDIMVIMLFSVLRAYRNRRDYELIILGGFMYAAIYCFNASILSSGGFLPTTVMLLGLGYNVFLVYQGQLFRNSSSNNFGINSLKTMVQILSVWSITLILLPWIILDAFEVKRTTNDLLILGGSVLFIIASILNLSSAYYLVKNGKGTPLPADQTNKLVTSGPYNLVRNPMALAGMGQSIALALFFGSLHLLIYTTIGGLLWHLVVRPIEEKNMRNRFGSEYDHYSKNVRLWIPRLK